MEILIPAWPHDLTPQLAGSTVRDLRGVRVAFVDDNFDCDFSDEVERLLAADYGAEVVRFLKPLGSAPSPRELIEQAANCDLAIVGIAL